MSSTVLVTGASGLLGRDIVSAFERDEWRVVGTALSRTNPPSIVKLDLQNKKSILNVLDDVKPQVIVHSAANRFPDKVEANLELAKAVNVTPTRFIAAEAAKRSIFFIYISTDYVFPGKPGDAPYTIESKAAPPNAYGQTKYDGEVAVLEETTNVKNELPVTGVVLRVPLLYGHCEKDDPSKSAVHPLVDAIWKAQKVKNGQPKVKVDDYALRYPTATEDVGRVCWDIAKVYTRKGSPDFPRILQFSSEDQYTKYGICKLFAEEILALPIDNIEPHDPTKDAAEAQSTTVRPYNTHLDTSALKKLGINISTLDFLAWYAPCRCGGAVPRQEHPDDSDVFAAESW